MMVLCTVSHRRAMQRRHTSISRAAAALTTAQRVAERSTKLRDSAREGHNGKQLLHFETLPHMSKHFPGFEKFAPRVGCLDYGRLDDLRIGTLMPRPRSRARSGA
jgi:hypothetical protein